MEYSVDERVIRSSVYVRFRRETIKLADRSKMHPLVQEQVSKLKKTVKDTVFFLKKKSRKRAFVEFRCVSRLIFEFRAPICFWVLFSARSVEVVHIII